MLLSTVTSSPTVSLASFSVPDLVFPASPSFDSASPSFTLSKFASMWESRGLGSAKGVVVVVVVLVIVLLVVVVAVVLVVVMLVLVKVVLVVVVLVTMLSSTLVVVVIVVVVAVVLMVVLGTDARLRLTTDRLLRPNP